MYDNLYLHGFEDSEAVSAAAGVPRGRGGGRKTTPQALLPAVACATRSPPPLHNLGVSGGIWGSRQSLPAPAAVRCIGGAGRTANYTIPGARLPKQQQKLPGCHLYGTSAGHPVSVGACGVDGESSDAGAGGGQGITGVTVSLLPKRSWDRLALFAGKRSPHRLPPSLAGKPVTSLTKWFSCIAEAPPVTVARA